MKLQTLWSTGVVATVLLASPTAFGADKTPTKHPSRKQAAAAMAFFGVPASISMTPEQKESLVSAYNDLAPRLKEAQMKSQMLLQQKFQQQINTPRRGRGGAPSLPANYSKDLASTEKDLQDVRAEMKQRLLGVLTEKQKAKLHLTEGNYKSAAGKPSTEKSAAARKAGKSS